MNYSEQERVRLGSLSRLRKDELGVPVRDPGRSKQWAKRSSLRVVTEGRVLLELFFGRVRNWRRTR